MWARWRHSCQRSFQRHFSAVSCSAQQARLGAGWPSQLSCSPNVVVTKTTISKDYDGFSSTVGDDDFHFDIFF